MNPLPAPHVPGKTDLQRFTNAMRTILSVPKEALVKAEAKRSKRQSKKR